MQKTNLLLTLAAALLLAPTTTALAKNAWQTVADIQNDRSTSVDALAKDAAGNLYAAVSATDAEGRTHAMIRKSSDRGATWSVVEDLVVAAGCSTKFLGLAADAAGHLYTAGYLADDEGQYRWIVRKSGVGGTTWTPVDDFALPGSERTVAQALTVDAKGHLYVVGFGDEPLVSGQSKLRPHWLLRHSPDGGQTWSTMDDFSYQFSAKAAAILSTPNGLFVAGSGWNGSDDAGEHWLVRKGTADGKGGFHWQTVDEFQLQKLGRGFVSQVHGLGLDAQGNLYAVGRSFASVDRGNSAHWVVRLASSAGTDWTVVDTFQLEAGSFAAASGVASGGKDGVYVVGRATDSRAGSHWIVRHSSTGEAGSWSVSDSFTLTAATTLLQGAGQVKTTADGSMVSLPGEFASGLAITSDSASVFAGGSVSGASNHALVRKLTVVSSTELAATATQ